jgi:hypothetical protein
MSSKLLADVGTALYGPRWQTELSRAIDVSDRTIRRWASGADDVPDGVYSDLLSLLTEKAGEVDDVISKINTTLEKLKRAAAPARTSK